MLTVLGHDRAHFEPVVITGEASSCDTQGGYPATIDNLRLLEEESTPYYIVRSLVRHINPTSDLRALWHLVRLLRQERPHIVHTHTSKAGVLGRLAAWITGVPVVIHTPHGHVFYGHFGAWPSWVFLHIERALAGITDWFIGLTPAEIQEHLEQRVGQPDRFAAVPSGIDRDRFRKARLNGKIIPDWFSCPSTARIIGSVGWLTKIKGHRFLVDALAHLNNEQQNLHLVIIGTGDQHDALLRQAEQAGISHAIHLLGHREDIEVCLAGFDCFVLPSLNEGMGRALVEAMAAGLPVIASRVGGIPALIENGKNGILVPAGDSSALANAIRKVIDDAAWAAELGTHARDSIDASYGIPAMVRSIESTYRKALAGYA
jgi:glycosyltransferase involved in cell wall biosynthesis